jgi:hypothetical protein
MIGAIALRSDTQSEREELPKRLADRKSEARCDNTALLRLLSVGENLELVHLASLVLNAGNELPRLPL